MATTAEPRHDSRGHEPTDASQGLGHRRRRPAASPDGVRAPRASPRRRRDQDHLRRHLPQRPAHRAATIGAARAIRCIPGHEIVGTRDRDRQRGHPPPRRRHGRGRLHGRQLHGLRPVPCRLGSVLPRRLHADLQQPRPPRREITKGGYTDHIVVRDHFVLKVPKAWTKPRRAVAVRRNHDLFAAAPVQCRPRHQDGGGRSGRAWSHGREDRRRAGRARDDDHHHAEQGQ